MEDRGDVKQGPCRTALNHMALLVSAPLAVGLLLAEPSVPLSRHWQSLFASPQMHATAQTTVSPTLAPAIRGRVVSARTGGPIAGASVFGFWLSDQFDTLHIAEAKSAADGTFVLPEWVLPSGERAILDRSSVIVFRRDYRVAHMPLATLVEQRQLPPIPLSLFVGPPVDRAVELSQLLEGLVLIVISAAEPRLPEVVIAVEAEQQTLPEEVRTGRMGRAEFEWMVNDARRVREQGSQGTK